MVVLNLVIRNSFFLLLILFSCSRTNKDKYVIDSCDIYLFELKTNKSDNINFRIGKRTLYQSVKKSDTVLLFFVFNKKFVSSSSNSNVPFEGMAGANDSIISLGILNSVNIIVDSSIVSLSNNEYINDILFTRAGSFLDDTIQINYNYFESKWDFESIIMSYNNNDLKEWYGSSRFIFPLLIKKQGHDKLLRTEIQTCIGQIPVRLPAPPR